MKEQIKQWFFDILYAMMAGLVVGFAYYFFQNSNGFAPGGVGGLATITYYLLDYRVSWAILMLAFNIPIFVLVSIFVNRRLGIILIVVLVIAAILGAVFAFFKSANFIYAQAKL